MPQSPVYSHFPDETSWKPSVYVCVRAYAGGFYPYVFAHALSYLSVRPNNKSFIWNQESFQASLSP